MRDRARRALVLCSKYSLRADDAYLTNEVVDELEARGFHITVIAVGNVEETAVIKSPRRVEVSFRTAGGGKAWRYVAHWSRAVWMLAWLAATGGRFDLLIAFAPLTVLTPVAGLATALRPRRSVCVVFDVFPLHHCQIGTVSSRLQRFLRVTERALLSCFDMVTGMSEANVRAIRDYYAFSSGAPALRVVHLWGANPDLIKRKAGTAGPPGTVRLVFGGQIVPGRRVDLLIDLLAAVRSAGVVLTLTIYSEGPGREELERNYGARYGWVNFQDRISREAYLDVLAGFDVGAIVTDDRVTLPTFPSKFIDYLNTGLRCFCMIEEASDMAQVVADADFLFVNHFRFGPEEVRAAVSFLSSAHTSVADAATETLYKRFSVRRATDQMLRPT